MKCILRIWLTFCFIMISATTFAQTTEEVSCYNCGGNGAIICYYCGGRRYFTYTIGYMWQNYPCGVCGAQGFVRCASCFGKGVITRVKPNPKCTNTYWNHSNGACMLCWMTVSNSGYSGSASGVNTYSGSGYNYSGSTGSTGSYSEGTSSYSNSNSGGITRKKCSSCEIPGNGNCRACKGMGHVDSAFSLDQMVCATCHGNKKCTYCNGTGWR